VIFTDSHAHLELVAARQGSQALANLLALYEGASEPNAASGPAEPDARHSLDPPSPCAAPFPPSARHEPLLLDPGVEADDLPRRLALVRAASSVASEFLFLRFAAGIWPSREALADPSSHLRILSDVVKKALPAAIGEAGLDYHHMNGSRESQRELFEGQLALASSLSLPIIVHSREAAADTLALVAGYARSIPVIIHCFGYGPGEAEAFLELGCRISFAGNLTYRSAPALREACALVPDDRLLLETDSPYMNPEPGRGRASSPLDIGRTYARAAAIRGDSPENLAALIARNAAILFPRSVILGA